MDPDALKNILQDTDDIISQLESLLLDTDLTDDNIKHINALEQKLEHSHTDKPTVTHMHKEETPTNTNAEPELTHNMEPPPTEDMDTDKDTDKDTDENTKQQKLPLKPTTKNRQHPYHQRSRRTLLATPTTRPTRQRTLLQTPYRRQPTLPQPVLTSPTPLMTIPSLTFAELHQLQQHLGLPN